MPTITQVSAKVVSFPNMFSSPFGNDGVIPLYSSVPINNIESGECLPCVACGNSTKRHEIIVQQTATYKNLKPNNINIALT